MAEWTSDEIINWVGTSECKQVEKYLTDYQKTVQERFLALDIAAQGEHNPAKMESSKAFRKIKAMLEKLAPKVSAVAQKIVSGEPYHEEAPTAEEFRSKIEPSLSHKHVLHRRRSSTGNQKVSRSD